MTSSRCLGLALIAVGLAGCGKPIPTPTTDTGSGAAAKAFFEALMREEWAAAYEALDPESRAACGKDQFATRAGAAMRQLGFVPTEVGVAVSETGDHAAAVAVYRGIVGTSPRQVKDGTALRRVGDGWAVVLRKNFGRATPAAGGKGGSGGKG
jgi:hypothetical protein